MYLISGSPISLMGFRHVLCEGGKGSLPEVSWMACYPLILEEDLQGTGGNADVNLFFDGLIRHAVMVAIDLNMVVYINPGLFPFSILMGT